MNEVMKALLERRSCKKYKADPVPQELIEQVIEAELYAASGMGKQSPIVVAVTDKKLRDRLSEVNAEIRGNAGQDMFYGAPVVLVVLADKSVPTCVYDGSVAIENMLLAAHSLGLGSCWIHRAKQTFEMDEFKALLKDLGIEGEYEGVGNCILGYAAEPAKPAAPRREGRVYWVK